MKKLTRIGIFKNIYNLNRDILNNFEFSYDFYYIYRYIIRILHKAAVKLHILALFFNYYYFSYNYFLHFFFNLALLSFFAFSHVYFVSKNFALYTKIKRWDQYSCTQRVLSLFASFSFSFIKPFLFDFFFLIYKRRRNRLRHFFFFLVIEKMKLNFYKCFPCKCRSNFLPINFLLI